MAENTNCDRIVTYIIIFRMKKSFQIIGSKPVLFLLGICNDLVISPLCQVSKNKMAAVKEYFEESNYKNLI